MTTRNFYYYLSILMLLTLAGCGESDDEIPPAVQGEEEPGNGEMGTQEPVVADHSVKTLQLKNVSKIELDSKGKAVVSFTVEPADAVFALDNLSLTLADDTGDAHEQPFCQVAELKPVYNSDSTKVAGQYEATIEDKNLSYGYDDQVVLRVTTENNKREHVTAMSAAFELCHKMRGYYQTGLPVMFIDTPNKRPIQSKTEYIENTRIVSTLADGTIDHEGVMSIRGRGNSSWGQPKKPYRIKLDEKTSLLGEHKDKSWVLIANYSDKTLMRNYIAFYMSQLSQLEYSPNAHFVELWLNGSYNGTYLLCEKLKIAKYRVNVGDDGFLLEVDGKAEAGDITFRTDHLGHPVNIKDPDLTQGDDNYNYVRNFVRKADNVLYGSGFTNQQTGWQAYMDMDSFVDWFLINEIARNVDAQMYTSCYMNLTRGGKLKMGPVWDFDLGFGNANYNNCELTNGYHIKPGPWFQRLFQDPAFVSKVKERFKFFYDKKSDILTRIDETATYLNKAANANEQKWHTFGKYVWPNAYVGANYTEDVNYLKRWFSERMDWLKKDLGV